MNDTWTVRELSPMNGKSMKDCLRICGRWFLRYEDNSMVTSDNGTTWRTDGDGFATFFYEQIQIMIA